MEKKLWRLAASLVVCISSGAWSTDTVSSFPHTQSGRFISDSADVDSPGSSMKVIIRDTCIAPYGSRKNRSEQPLIMQQDHEFLDRPVFAVSTPVGPPGHRQHLVFEGEPLLHFSLWNNVRLEAEKGGSVAHVETFSCKTHIRMYDMRSNPVVMPSYKPCFTAQLFHLGYPATEATSVLSQLSFFLGHYSNGQKGCLFDAGMQDLHPGCDSINCSMYFLNPSRHMNRSTGDFAVNFIGGSLGSKMMWLDMADRPETSVSLHLSYTHHFAKGSPTLVRLYGRNRLELTAEFERVLAPYRKFATRARLRVLGSYAKNRHPSIPDGYIELETSATWHYFYGFGVFMRFHAGQDRYNAYFVDDVRQFMIGFIWEQAQLFRYNWRAAR